LANGSRLLTEIVHILMKKMKKNNIKFCYLKNLISFALQINPKTGGLPIKQLYSFTLK